MCFTRKKLYKSIKFLKMKEQIRDQIKDLTINKGAHTITGLESTLNNFVKCGVEEMIGNKLPYSVVYKNGLLYAVSDIRSGRCKGNSTRQINDTYDLFFSLPKGSKHVGFEDHDVNEYGENANYISMKKLTYRLLTEGRCIEYKSDMDIQTSKVRVIEIGSNYIKALNF